MHPEDSTDVVFIALEFGSGWHWGWALSYRFPPGAVVLVQQAGEPAADFARRIRGRLKQIEVGESRVIAAFFGAAPAAAPPALAAQRLIFRALARALPRGASVAVLAPPRAVLVDNRVQRVALLASSSGKSGVHWRDA